MNPFKFWISALILCSICRAVGAEAAAKVTLTQTAEGVYSVTAVNVKKASSLGFTIPYNIATLSSPVITDGPFATKIGATRLANDDSKRGELRVVYVLTSNNVYFEGGDLLATVRFTKIGTTSSSLTDFKSEIVSSGGTQMAVESVVATPAGTDSKAYLSGYNTGTNTTKPTSQNYDNMGNLPSRPTTQTVTSSDAITSQPPISGAGQESSSRLDVSSPEYAGDTPQQQSRVEDLGTAVVQDVVTPAVAGQSQKADPDSSVEVLLKKLKSLESVAERFRAYKGARTLKGFSELFDDSRYKAAGVAQMPGIAVSDGKKMITVKVSLPVGSGVPSFSLKGANLKGIKNLSDRSLELDAMPQKGKLDVRMSIVIQKEVAEIPLLVVPPLSGDILEQSDQALEKLLSKVDGKNKSLLYDLNADGKQDYLDDYILVAHWLLKQQRDKKVPAAKAAAPR